MDSPGSQARIAPRRATRPVCVGALTIGGDSPILIQSMTVADTMDTEAVVAEIRGLVEAGCPLVRVTVPSLREAENLRAIRRRLAEESIRVPLVADIHFTPNAALLAADLVEKVRINPGNYADRKRFEVRDYSDREYAAELERVADRFRPLVRKLKANGVALRIGVNHGSLSDRIMNRFGDTPEGMVESAIEFVRFCEDEAYRDIVLSMKSSIPTVMAAAYRLLDRRLRELGMDYPFHLGVTEAGDGLDGRIKSAVGIGALLADGIGDTIRVSLTEDSRHEIAAARAILDAVERERGSGVAATGRPVQGAILSSSSAGAHRTPAAWMLRDLPLGGGAPVAVEERINLASVAGAFEERVALAPDAGRVLEGAGRLREGERADLISVDVRVSPEFPASRAAEALERFREGEPRPVLLEWGPFADGDIHALEMLLPFVDALGVEIIEGAAPMEKIALLARLLLRRRKPIRFRLPFSTARLAGELAELCREEGLNTFGFLCAPGPFLIERTRAVAEVARERGGLIFLEAPGAGADAALLTGTLLFDGIGDAVCLLPWDDGESTHPWPSGGRSWREDPVSSAFRVLQACRLRLTRAEFIACPSCGRTQFELLSTTEKIRTRTEHLKGLKIAIMGCIVNGPGEMADADFGYVGSGPGRVDLYVGRERVAQNVPEGEAPDRLCDLIRERGRWVDRA